jgi:hypothetical protein
MKKIIYRSKLIVHHVIVDIDDTIITEYVFVESLGLLAISMFLLWTDAIQCGNQNGLTYYLLKLPLL